MIAPKILIDGSYQPDLSLVDLESNKLLGNSLNDDGENYTLVLESLDKKREAYEKELGHLVQQYKRYEILDETEKLADLAEEIRLKTIEIRNRFNLKITV